MRSLRLRTRLLRPQQLTVINNIYTHAVFRLPTNLPPSAFDQHYTGSSSFSLQEKLQSHICKQIELANKIHKQDSQKLSIPALCVAILGSCYSGPISARQIFQDCAQALAQEGTNAKVYNSKACWIYGRLLLANDLNPHLTPQLGADSLLCSHQQLFNHLKLLQRELNTQERKCDAYEMWAWSYLMQSLARKRVKDSKHRGPDNHSSALSYDSLRETWLTIVCPTLHNQQKSWQGTAGKDTYSPATYSPNDNCIL